MAEIASTGICKRNRSLYGRGGAAPIDSGGVYAIMILSLNKKATGREGHHVNTNPTQLTGAGSVDEIAPTLSPNSGSDLVVRQSKARRRVIGLIRKTEPITATNAGSLSW